jgi:hypothetical protein
MSIPVKRRRSLGGESAGERQHSECLTPQTSTTATDNSASASAALTPLTAMEASEVGKDDSKSLAETVGEERLQPPHESSWQGWAELENDPVFSNCNPILCIL